jgi:hypothetical protein
MGELGRLSLGSTWPLSAVTGKPLVSAPCCLLRRSVRKDGNPARARHLGRERALMSRADGRVLEGVGDRQTTVTAERARGDLDTGRRLTPFVLGEVHEPYHATDLIF